MKLTGKMKLLIVFAVAGLIIVGGGISLLFRSYTTSKEEHGALVNYENLLVSCETRGNELRTNQMKLATIDARSHEAQTSSEGEEVVDSLLNAEFALADGSINCERAFQHP